MTFTLVQPREIRPEQLNPMVNLIPRALQQYNQSVQSAYLKPTLEEELQKAKLYNKWYEPNIQSQIGLRGAQAGQARAHTGLLGQQTRAAQLENQYLPQKLQAEMEARKLAALQNQMFNQMLQERLSGEANQSSMNAPEYAPGQGQAPTAFTQSSVAPQQAQQPSMGQPPQLTNEDIVNKKFFKIDTYTPRYKAYIDSITKNMNAREAEKIKTEAKKELKDYDVQSKAEQDLPVLENALQNAVRMREIIASRPAFFGHNIAPGLFAKRSTDPLVGEFQGHLIPQIAAMEQQLSSRGNQLALKTASSKLPGFDETQQSALGKMDAYIATLQSQINNTKNLAGGNIIRRGTKRFILIDGVWHELERGEY